MELHTALASMRPMHAARTRNHSLQVVSNVMVSHSSIREWDGITQLPASQQLEFASKHGVQSAVRDLGACCRV
ncbi:MAG: hypothetical protein ABI593_12780 [Betaproteobacteria bacterium]